MKKVFALCMLALVSISMSSIPQYLVQTGQPDEATWASSVVSATGATLVDLRTANKEFDEWINTTEACEIWLAAGVYYVNSGITAVQNYLLYGGFSGAELTIDARDYDRWQFGHESIIDGDGVRIVLDGKQVQGCTWDGLTFRNSQGNNGGVARIHHGTHIYNCKFLNNTALNQGGALQAYNYGVIEISNCYFEGNKGKQGGAIYVGNNRVQDSYTINNCYFKENEATGTVNAGGAIHAQGKCLMAINACIFEGNTAAGNGDAISSDIKGDDAAKTNITNCLLIDQTGSKPAVYLAEGVLYNCTFANNAGGAIYTAGTDAKAIANNIIWGSNAQECKLALEDNANSSLKNNAMGKLITYEYMVQENNVAIDTLQSAYFKDTALKDFHLTKAATAMIGTGLDLSAEGVTTDIAGSVRTVGSYDMGCYIYVNDSETGCDNISTNQTDGIRYNLLGKPVDETYRGVVIMNGKKYMQ